MTGHWPSCRWHSENSSSVTGQCLQTYFDGLSAYRTSGLKTCLLGNSGIYLQSGPQYGTNELMSTPISKPPTRHKTICPEMALEPGGHEHHSTGSGTGMVEHHQAIAADTLTLSRSATDTSNDGGSSKCWCLHFVQVTASVILKMAC